MHEGQKIKAYKQLKKNIGTYGSCSTKKGKKQFGMQPGYLQDCMDVYTYYTSGVYVKVLKNKTIKQNCL